MKKAMSGRSVKAMASPITSRGIASIHRQASGLTDFRNKYRPKDVREGSGGGFAPGKGDYDDGEMIFPTKSTFILQGIMPGHTIVKFFSPERRPESRENPPSRRDIMESGITPNPARRSRTSSSWWELGKEIPLQPALKAS